MALPSLQVELAKAKSVGRGSLKAHTHYTLTPRMSNWRSDARLQALTPHQRAVYELTSAIPAGRMSTYGVLAALLGSGSQSVGTALHNNPFAPHVPCHRIAKSGDPPTIGGFSGAQQGSGNPHIERKKTMLKAEGVLFDDKWRMIDPARLMRESDFPKAAVDAALAILSGKRPAAQALAPTAEGAPTNAEPQPKRARSAAAPTAPAASASAPTHAAAGDASSLLLLRAALSSPGASGASVRSACRSGALRGHTSGLAPGFAQANLVILPAEHALAFLTFCVRNPKPCPLLEVTDVGCFEARAMAPDSDIRCDLPAYRVWRNGECTEEVPDITHLWPAPAGAAAGTAATTSATSSSAVAAAGAAATGASKKGAAKIAASSSALSDAASAINASSSRKSSSSSSAAPTHPDARTDWVAFLLGCSFSFEEALLEKGLPVRHLQEERAPVSTSSSSLPSSSHSLAANPRNVPMYKTSIPTVPAHPFHGPLVVSMRPMTAAQASTAAAVTGQYPRVHGAPVYAGTAYASALGINDLSAPDYGDAVTVMPGELPVFWACGVTPQAALVAAKIPLAITHAPGHMFVTDVLNTALAGEAEVVVK